MNRTIRVSTLFLMIATAGSLAHSQALSTASGAGGNQVAIGAGMVNTAFEGLFIDAGTVIEDYLYLGLGWNLQQGFLVETPMQQSMLRGVCAIPVLAQDEVIPVTFLLTGVYQRISTTSDYLETAELIRTGTGYEIAVDLFRDFAIIKGISLRAGLSGVYAAGTIITESAIGATTPVSAVQEQYVNYLYGIKIGVLYAMDKRLVLGASLNGQLDADFGIHYGLVFNISSKKSIIK